MFKRIRMISMVILSLVVVLTIAITPAFADTAPLSGHTIYGNSTVYYYTGSQCYQSSPHNGAAMYEYFATPNRYWNTGTTNWGNYFSYNQTGQILGWESSAIVPSGTYFKFYTSNKSASSITVNSGSITWNVY